jgi:DNA-binding transcriptional ArsR family regulator
VPDPGPAEVWAALAPLLAGRPRVRLSRDGGRNYPLRNERDLTPALPAQPAAPLIHTSDGTCRTLCLDFDAKGAGGEREVLADVHTVSGLLHEAGAAWIRDRSPNGGRHLYVPLAEPLAFHRARELVEAIGIIAPTLDPSPHRGIRHGCIRMPGAVHRSGGHQELEMSLEDALAVASHPNGADAMDRLWDDLTEQRRLVRAAREAEEEPWAETAPLPHHDDERPLQPATVSDMSADMLRTATDGTWNRNRYSTASEARQAVLVSAAAAGLQLVDIQRRIQTGIWPGFAQFYARYSPTHRQAALKRDWVEARRYTASRSPQTVRKTNTSRPTTQRGGQSDFHFVRTWLNALSASEARYGNDRRGLTKRLVLRAIAEACMKSGSRIVSFGVRSLAIAVGTDAGTVSRHLKELRTMSVPLIRLVRHGRGTEADAYELVIPDHLQNAAESRSWRSGKIHALRPVFRALGVPGALVFEELERAGNPMPVKTLVRQTGLSRSAVNDALVVLASWRLAEGTQGVWSAVANADLDELAERLGVAEDVAAQVSRYLAERAEWHAWLRARAEAHSAGYLDDLQFGSLLWELAEPPDETVVVIR